jgi:homoserine dehydrogenase
MTNKKISIGLFGFGVVGQGLYDVLNHSQGLRANINKICLSIQIKTYNFIILYLKYLNIFLNFVY